VSLDLRLLRAARAFLDPELQSGKLQPEDALPDSPEGRDAVPCIRHRRGGALYVRQPGQANSYSTGIRAFSNCAKATQKALGASFDQEAVPRLHPGPGLLPPDLMEKAVNEIFVPQQRSGR